MKKLSVAKTAIAPHVYAALSCPSASSVYQESPPILSNNREAAVMVLRQEGTHSEC